jgi:hypothetical protein
MTNTEKLYDYISFIIRCDYCSNIGQHNPSVDVEDAASDFAFHGWRVIRSGKVKCPTCSVKSKRKNK